MFSIRKFVRDDFEMIQSWWTKQNEFAPTLDMLPEESTFICELNKVPMVAITLYLTNSKEFCMLDNFVGNPDMRGNMRSEASRIIINHAEQFAKELGYKSITCLALKDKLKEYYQSFGYTKRFDNVASFNKELV